MAGLDELVQRLQALGFSQYEARAYCALLQKSPANGHEVAKLAAIPTSKVYETLERLKQKGAVLVQRSEPTLWAPVPHRGSWAGSAVTWSRPSARSSRASPSSATSRTRH